MIIFLHRHKITKKHAGYTSATFPAKMEGNYETLLKDVSDEDYKKIYDGWEVGWNGDEIESIIETQYLKDIKTKREQKRLLKDKINKKTATLDEIMDYLAD